MIKSLLYVAGKELLFMAGLFLSTFILSAGVSIQLKPFHISFNHPAFGIGLTLMAIGFVICMGSSYCSGREHGDYDTGYKKGSDDTLEYIIICQNPNVFHYKTKCSIYHKHLDL